MIDILKSHGAHSREIYVVLKTATNVCLPEVAFTERENAHDFIEFEMKAIASTPERTDQDAKFEVLPIKLF
jgi:hypothetical protein